MADRPVARPRTHTGRHVIDMTPEERAEVHQDLLARENDLAQHLERGPMNTTPQGLQLYSEHTARILHSIDTLERMLGIKHLRVVA